MATTRKRRRSVYWRADRHSVQGYPTGVRITVTDPNEPDRPYELLVSDEDAIYLASQLADLSGHKLVTR